MKLEQLKREIKNKSPKTFAKATKHWSYKMIMDVSRFTVEIGSHIYFKDKRYDGPEIEELVWKLLVKARRLK